MARVLNLRKVLPISSRTNLYRRLSEGSKETDPPPSHGRFADSSGLGPKKFYKTAEVKETGGNKFGVVLDGRPVKTPQRQLLESKSPPLMTAVALEWDSQTNRIRPSSMPLTHLLTASIDIVPYFRQRSVDSMIKYLDTDTICFRTTYPLSLAEEQQQRWDPIVQHMSREHSVILPVTDELSATSQPPAVKEKFEKLLHKLNNIEFAAMESAISTSKSFSIGLALRSGFLNAQQAIAAARCDEEFQARVWGEVEGGHDIDRADISVRLFAAAAVFRIASLNPSLFVER
eukprot:Plantae.Rhodophyta-Purpureofilum_apyrenoidigerum.ctg376.p1 GENE.Plantae.Rhodophyta-Purpureofilum_apyrenoidigerum.ctg376~~Plantae.Rhodophyta-Purpureofilum_apyrenoidigerum.ctg376.p1  ORF type:complete len:288 (-),score=35.11 Plantae.Rhodophyta-Purpureofilum_apyrenoidigerum.ctg376:1103-1966(-)